MCAEKESLDHYERSLSHVGLRHISTTAVSRLWPANLVSCLYFCLLVVVQDSSKRRQLQTVLNACSERFEQSHVI